MELIPRPLAQLLRVSPRPTAAKLSPDARWLAVSAFDREVSLVDLADEQPTRRLGPLPREGARACGFLSNRVIVGCSETLASYELESGTMLRCDPREDEPIEPTFTVAVGPDELALGAFANAPAIWNARTGVGRALDGGAELNNQLLVHAGLLIGTTFRALGPPGPIAALGWAPTTGEVVSCYAPIGSEPGYPTALWPAGEQLIVGFSHGQVIRYGLRNPTEHELLTTTGDYVQALVGLPGGGVACVVEGQHRAMLLDRADGASTDCELPVRGDHEHDYPWYTPLADGWLACLAERGRTLVVTELETGRRLEQNLDERGTVLVGGGRTMAIAGVEGGVTVVDLCGE